MVDSIARLPQIGDHFILLTPSHPRETNAIQVRQRELQAIYGGELIDPVHLTFQRFLPRDDAHARQIVHSTRGMLSCFQPFPLWAGSTFSAYSKFRQGRILKWRLLPCDPATEIEAVLSAMLDEMNAPVVNPPADDRKDIRRRRAVTALEDISDLDSAPAGAGTEYPYPLFTAGTVTVSRVTGPNRFEIAARFPLGTRSTSSNDF
jgi:hypothetical protein